MAINWYNHNDVQQHYVYHFDGFSEPVFDLENNIYFVVHHYIFGLLNFSTVFVIVFFNYVKLLFYLIIKYSSMTFSSF